MSNDQGLYQDNFIEALRRGLAGVLHRWELSVQTGLNLLCISENATFRADDPKTGQSLVIRVHRPGYHSRAEIESELQWLAALGDAGILPTAQPVATTDGEHLVAFEDAGDSRDCVAFSLLPGVEPEESGDLDGWFRHLGEITAKLHAHARSWTPPAGFTRKVWNFETTLGETAYWGDWRNALGLDPDGHALLEQCSEQLRLQLERIGQGPDCFGLIHADLRLANLLVHGDRLSVIDFDDCGFGWYLYDFAAAVSFIETSPNLAALQQAWVDGYRRVSELDDAEVDQLSTFVMLRRMLLTAWIASHHETPTARELGAEYTQGTLDLARSWLRRRA